MSFRPKEFLRKMDEYFPKMRQFDDNFYSAMINQEKAAFKDGHLTLKMKEFIAIALSISTKCPYCIPYHVKRALKAGASKEELLEVAEVAIAMGGLPAATYTTMMIEAIEVLSE